LEEEVKIPNASLQTVYEIPFLNLYASTKQQENEREII